MKNINIASTLKIPKVNFDYKKGLIELTGRSTPEDTDNLYRPLLNWLKEYITKPQPKTIVNINLEYFNSSSTKYITRLLEQLSFLVENNHPVEFNWFYIDEETKEEGEDFADILDLDFKLIQVDY